MESWARAWGALAMAFVLACGDDSSTGGGGTAGNAPGGASAGGASQGGGGGAAGGSSAGGAEQGGAEQGGAEQGGAGQGGAQGSSVSTTSCPGDTCDLTIEVFGLEALDGRTLRFGAQVQGKQGLADEGSAVIQGGEASGTLVGALDKGASYYLSFYVDVSDNGACEANPTDIVGRVATPPVNESYLIRFTDDGQLLSNLGCAGFP